MEYTDLEDDYPPRVGTYRVHIRDINSGLTRNTSAAFDGDAFSTLGKALTIDEIIVGWAPY